MSFERDTSDDGRLRFVAGRQPGRPDETLRAHARHAEEREAEARVLSDPTLAEEAARNGIELISFYEV